MLQSGSVNGFDITLTDPGILWLRFNTPERLNGMTAAIKRDLIETLTQAQMDDQVRIIVFTGSGRAFCAGDELGGYTDPADEETALTAPIHAGHHNALGTFNGLRTISQQLNTTVRRLDKITIAAINGITIQTGLSLALACDFRLAATSARLGSATLRFGLLPDEGGHALLLEHLGLSQTLDFVLRKRIVTAAQALELGLVSDVVDDDELENATQRLAEELARGPQVALRMAKRSIYAAVGASWDGALEDIAAKTAIVDHHPDAREGVLAFKEKRAPKFNAWLEQS
ncbi:MAG: enoyl-CoA hydratase/isomerase family protein [Pseudomonadota bacterium]